MKNYDEIKQELKMLANLEGMRFKEFLSHIGVAPSSFYEKRPSAVDKCLDYLYANRGDFGAEKGKRDKEPDFIEYIDKNVSEDVNWREMFDHFQKHQDMTDRMDNKQVFATIKIKTDKDHIALGTSADWHLGSASVDYSDFRKNIEYVLGTDGLYLLCCGDYRDNFVNFKNAYCNLKQIMGIEEQNKVLASILKEFKEKKKVLAMTWGNHDDKRDEKNTGFSVVKQMFGNDFVYFAGMGVLNIELINSRKGTKVCYSIVMSHDGKGYSMYNENHGQRRLYKEFYPGDVIVTAHRHKPAFQYAQMYLAAADQGKDFGGEAWFIQTGTFKTRFDEHSNRHFGRGVAGMPTILLSSTKKSVQVFKNPELCECFLK